MDPNFTGFFNSPNEFQLGNESEYPNLEFEISYPDDQELVNGQRINSFFQEHNPAEIDLLADPNRPKSNGTASTSLGTDDYQDDCDFSDTVLRYIDQMLMEEDMEDKTHMLQESLDLQAKEMSFYEVLCEKYTPPSNDEKTDDYCSGYLIDVIDPSRISNHTNSHTVCNVVDGLSDSPISPLQIRDKSNERQSVWNFKKGVEESNDKGKQKVLGKKSRDIGPDTILEEARITKIPSMSVESNLPIEEFDEALLYTLGENEKKFVAYRDGLLDAANKGACKNEGSNGKKIRGKKPARKKQVIDLRTLLITCAQAVAADDRRNAAELLKQIRQHSSPFGDGNQRLSHYFADGLEARLAGTGSQIHKSLVNKRTTAADYLKAYYLFLASSPFRKISNYVSNVTIMKKSVNFARVHVIDFGILYGFQWPTLIQRIADRKNGPPRLRITGIDFPQPGFKPAERIEETGRRLGHYADMFKVPFGYKAIAQKWETIKIEDLKIEEGEFVVVTCIYRGKNLSDETLISESSRTAVLELIRKINPNIFIHGIVNGAYSAPFFVTRFREVMFHFSALFDMLETMVPREKPERRLIERDIFGSEALNVIACEGWERVERPETYKQWQVRDMKAGFLQVPFNREIMDQSTYKMRNFYHKDFVIDEDGQWLLLGWKGRIIYAISCWETI